MAEDLAPERVLAHFGCEDAAIDPVGAGRTSPVFRTTDMRSDK